MNPLDNLTEGQLRALLRETHGLTDEDIEAMLAQEAHNPDAGIGVTNVARSMGEGMTFGHMDNVVAGAVDLAHSMIPGAYEAPGTVTSPPGVVLTPDQVRAQMEAGRGSQSVYDSVLESERDANKAFKDQHPVVAGAAEIGGSMLLPGAVVGNTARGASTMTKLGIGAGTGTATGAAYAHGALDGKATAKDLLTGGAVGGVGGAFGGLLIEKLGKTGAMLWNKYVAGSPTNQAKRMIRKAVEASGMTPADAEAIMRRMDVDGPKAILADVSEELLNLTRAVQSMPNSPARDALAATLAGRGREQLPHMLDLVKNLTGVNASAEAFEKALRKKQTGAAKANYDAAYKVGLRETEKLRSLLDRPAVKKAWKLAAEDRKNRGEPMRVLIKGGKFVETPNTREWDLIQRQLRWAVEQSKRDPSLARTMGQESTLRSVRNEIVGELDTQNPAFKKAREEYAGYLVTQEAVKSGRRFDKLDPEELADLMLNATPSEKQAFLVGTVHRMKEMLGSRGDGTTGSVSNIGNHPLFNSPNHREKLAAVLGDDVVDQLLQRAKDMGRMQFTNQKLTQRSPTGDILLGQEAIVNPGMVDAAKSFLVGDMAHGTRSAFNALASGQAKVPDSILEAYSSLLSRPGVNPSQALSGGIPFASPDRFAANPMVGASGASTGLNNMLIMKMLEDQ